MRTLLASFSHFLDRKDRQFVEIFTAQILGFITDFHRKSIDIVKQHPNNAGIWADSVF